MSTKNTQISKVNKLLSKAIREHQNFSIDEFHYSICYVKDNLITLIGDGTVIVSENFLNESNEATGIGQIYKNDAGTDYGWLIRFDGVRAFIDCDKDIHVWDQDYINSEHGDVCYIDHNLLNEETKQFLSNLNGSDENLNERDVVISFAND